MPAMQWREFEKRIEAALPGATEVDDYVPASVADSGWVEERGGHMSYKEAKHAARFSLFGLAMLVTYRFDGGLWGLCLTTTHGRGVEVQGTTLPAAVQTALGQLADKLHDDRRHLEADNDAHTQLALLAGTVFPPNI